jgi:hypothetical protein
MIGDARPPFSTQSGTLRAWEHVAGLTGLPFAAGSASKHSGLQHRVPGVGAPGTLVADAGEGVAALAIGRITSTIHYRPAYRHRPGTGGGRR